MQRFNILVLNHNRLSSFVDNFDKIRGFNSSQDRITILTCSPSEEETQQIKAFSEKYELEARYLARRNFGIDQGARIEYFTGLIDSLEEVLDTEYIFQFQDHYLDIQAPYSRWGKEFNFRIKGDVVPDNVTFDLNLLSGTFRQNDIAAAFCDRNNPCWFERAGRRHIAPNGGNYLLSTDQIKSSYAQTELKNVYQKCDDTYRWALYAEYKLGEILFKEGKRYYDIKRDKIYSEFPKDEFYISPDPVQELYDDYEAGPLNKTIRRLRSRISAIARLVNQKA
jgi:hypothetical protein